MSTIISYAHAAASTGASTPTSSEEVAPETFEAPQETPSTPSKDTATPGKRSPSSSSSATPEKKDSEVHEKKLAPAPPPATNAWGKSVKLTDSAGSSAAVISETIFAESARSDSNRSDPGSHAKSSNGREKWVPYKASVVIASGKKSGKDKNQKSNSGNSSSKKKGKRKSAQQQQKPKKGGKSKETPKEDTTKDSGKAELQPSEAKPAAKATAATAAKPATASAAAAPVKAVNGDKPAEAEAPAAVNGNKHHAQNNQNNQNRRYGVPYVPYGGQYYMPMPPYNGGAYPSPPMGYMPYNPAYNPMPTRGQMFTPPSQRDRQLDSVAHQIDYYFSAQNLIKDVFLRKGMNDDGFLPLSVIAAFYRVSSLSLNDIGTVIESLHRCNNLEFGVVETDGEKIYMVRPVPNYAQWVLSVDQRTDTGKLGKTPSEIQSNKPDASNEAGQHTESHPAAADYLRSSIG